MPNTLYQLAPPLNETTLSSLMAKTVRGFPGTKKRQHIAHKAKVGKPIIFANPDTGRVVATAEVTGSAEAPYVTVITGTNIKTYAAPSAGRVGVSAGSKGKVYITPIDLRRKDVEVRCSCPDFRYRFGWYDHKDGSLFGKPPPKYVATVRPGTANPTKVPGVCKHVMQLARVLERRGLVAHALSKPDIQQVVGGAKKLAVKLSG